METILSYLDNMFLNLPKTAETARAKKELATMMEDKYNELLSEGKKENEAVGIVISEFGNLEELSEELGLGDIRQKPIEKPIEKRYVSREEAENYISTAGKAFWGIAIGAMLCIFCPIPLLIAGTWAGATDVSTVCLGLVPMFILIAIAVGILIYNGMKMEKFEFMKREVLQIDGSLERELRERKEAENGKFVAKIIAGVLICILAVIQLLVFGVLFEENDFILAISVSLLLVLIGIAVVCFIRADAERECYKVLLQEEDFTADKKKNNKVLERISGVYWMAATVVYLAWSFITFDWGFTWIVWPIAGVLYGLIAAICNAVIGVTGERE